MRNTERVTVTLPGDVLREVDRRGRNRSRFVLEAVERELERRHREDLRRSIEHPHPDGKELSESGFDEWVHGLPEEDADGLLDPKAGTPVRWAPGAGWAETDE
jgi:hypothetical protein